MEIDTQLTERAAQLLRNYPHLLAAAAPLLGKIAVRFRPAPPPRAEPKKPPQRPGAEAKDESGQVTAAPPGPPAMPSPWNKAAVAKKAGKDVRFEDGKPIAAEIVVDGACWDALNEQGRTFALCIALRSIRHKERADGSDMVKIEKPPVQCWPDMTGEAVELIAQLGPDGATGAALTGCFVEADEVDALGAAIAAFQRRLDAGQDLIPHFTALHQQLGNLHNVVSEMESRTEPAGDDEDGPSDNGPSADIEAA